MNANLGKTEFTDVEVADLRDRLKAVRDEQQLTWKQLAAVVGVPEGTISAWVPGKYLGKDDGIAAKVHRYFLAQDEREELSAELPTVPDFVQTTTARRVLTALAVAQQGDMAAVAGVPGLGKTASLIQFKATRPNVWMTTIRPSNGGVQTMLLSILRGMGQANAKGTPQVLSDTVMGKIRGTRGLLVIDDAQNLSIKAAEELRGIHDDTGVGIALVGHLELITSLLRPHAQLYSRFGVKLVQRAPLREDAQAIAAAWGVEKGPELTKCIELGRRQGGLRTLTKTLRNATFLARREGVPLHLTHINDAAAQGDIEIGA